MNPFFFGSSQTQLLGVYHAPERDEIRDGAVLICPPLGHEYIAAHGSLQQLAGKLARAGFHVLRFDFFGCGDSAGDLDQASVGQWLEDVATAAQELKDTSGARRISVIGLRLGAALGAIAAARAGANGDGARACVLWEPVVRGKDYLAELEETQQRWIGAMYTRLRREMVEHDGPEVMGFQLPPALQRELASIDLLGLTERPADRVLIVQNTDEADYGPLQGRLAQPGNGVAYERIPSHKAWLGEHWTTIALPPHDVLGRIVQWMTEAHR